MAIVGKVTHYFPKVSVAVVEVSGTIKVGDKIKFEDHGATFEQEVESMEMEHKKLDVATKGMAIGMKVAGNIKPGATVSKE